MAFAQKKHVHTGDADKSMLAFSCHCLTSWLCLIRYLNGVRKNGAAPVLLELANEVMLLLLFYLNLHKT